MACCATFPVKKICKEYLKGISADKIAIHYNTYHSKILRILEKAGIERRAPQLANRKYAVNDKFFSRLNELSCFWAGFIAADGCIVQEGSKSDLLSIMIHGKDEQFLKQFMKDIKCDYPIYRYTSKIGSPIISIRITSNQISHDLKHNFNITPRKSLTYKAPKLSDGLMKHFIRGYIAGDGCVCLSKGQIYLDICGTKSTMSTFRNWFEKSCLLNHIKLFKTASIFSLRYRGRAAIKAMSILHKDARRFMWRKTLEAKGIKNGLL
jgi:hypothetical protein